VQNTGLLNASQALRPSACSAATVVWRVMLPLFIIFGSVYCKTRAFGSNLDCNDFDWQFDFFSGYVESEAYTNLSGNM